MLGQKVPYGSIWPIMSTESNEELLAFRGSMRCSRALSRWSVDQLAREASLGRNTIKRAEAKDGKTSLTTANELAIRRAFEAAGVEFTNGEQPGVRLAKVAAAHSPEPARTSNPTVTAKGSPPQSRQGDRQEAIDAHRIESWAAGQNDKPSRSEAIPPPDRVRAGRQDQRTKYRRQVADKKTSALRCQAVEEARRINLPLVSVTAPRLWLRRRITKPTQLAWPPVLNRTALKRMRCLDLSKRTGSAKAYDSQTTTLTTKVAFEANVVRRPKHPHGEPSGCRVEFTKR